MMQEVLFLWFNTMLRLLWPLSERKGLAAKNDGYEQTLRLFGQFLQ